MARECSRYDWRNIDPWRVDALCSRQSFVVLRSRGGRLTRPFVFPVVPTHELAVKLGETGQATLVGANGCVDGGDI